MSRTIRWNTVTSLPDCFRKRTILPGLARFRFSMTSSGRSVAANCGAGVKTGFSVFPATIAGPASGFVSTVGAADGMSDVLLAGWCATAGPGPASCGMIRMAITSAAAAQATATAHFVQAFPLRVSLMGCEFVAGSNIRCSIICMMTGVRSVSKAGRPASQSRLESVRYDSNSACASGDEASSCSTSARSAAVSSPSW